MSSKLKKISYKFSITNLVLVNQVYPFDFFLRVRGVNSQQSQDSPIIEANKMQCDQVFPWEFAMNEVVIRVQFVQITKNTRIEVLRAHFNVNAVTDEDGETVAMLASRSSKKLCIVTYKLQPYTQIRQVMKQKPQQKAKNHYEEDEEEQQKNDTSPQKEKKNVVLFSKQQHDQLSKQIAQINKSIDKILQNQKTQHALFNKYLDQSTSFIKEVMNNSRANRYNDSDNENEGDDGKNNKANTQNILKQIQEQSQPQLDSINNSGIIKSQNPVQNIAQNPNQNQNKQNEQKVQPQKANQQQATSAKWYKLKFNKPKSQKIAKNINYRKQNFANSQASSDSQVTPQVSEFSLQYSQNNPSPSLSSLIIYDLSVNSSVKPYQIKISQLLLQNMKDNQNLQGVVQGDSTKLSKKQNKQKKDNLLLTIKSKSGPCFDWKKSFQLPSKRCYIVGIIGNINGNKEKQKQIQLVGCIASKQLQRGKVSLFDDKGQQKGYMRFNHKLLNAYSVQTHQLLDLSKLSQNQDEQKENQKKNTDKQIKQQPQKQENNDDNKKQKEDKDEQIKQKDEAQENDKDQQKQIKGKDKLKEKEKEKENESEKEQRYQLKQIHPKDVKNSARIRRLSIEKEKNKKGQKKIQKQQLQNKQQALQSQQQGQRRRVKETQRFKQIQKERSKQKFKLYKVIYEDKDKNIQMQKQKQKQNQNQKKSEKLKGEEKVKENEKVKVKENENEKMKENEKENEKKQEDKQEKQKIVQKQDDKKNKKYNLVSNSISVSFLPMKKKTISEQSVHRRTPFLSEQQISSINSSQFISKIKTINLKIDSVSAKLSKNPNQFAGKFVKLSIRNKNPFMTETINLSQNLIWQCKGCIFDSVSPYAQLLVQLCSDQNNRPKTIGKAKICLALLNMQKQNRVQFYHQFLKDQNQNHIGELIIGYDNIEKTRRIQSGKKSVNNSVQHYNNADDGLEEQNEHNLSGRQEDASQRKRKVKTKSKPKLKKKNKPEYPQNTNRTQKKSGSYNIGMDGSQAKLVGSTGAIRAKKYTGGNIIIGRAQRFRHGTDQKPGPGKYEMPSTFERHAANT